MFGRDGKSQQNNLSWHVGTAQGEGSAKAPMEGPGLDWGFANFTVYNLSCSLAQAGIVM